MEIRVTSLKNHSALESGIRKSELDAAVAFVFSDSATVQQLMFERYAPKNSYMAYGVESISPFHTFKHNGVGIGGMIGTTFVSWLAGKIDDKDVIFVHPTSNTVNYDEVNKGLTEIKDIPIVDFDDILIHF